MSNILSNISEKTPLTVMSGSSSQGMGLLGLVSSRSSWIGILAFTSGMAVVKLAKFYCIGAAVILHAGPITVEGINGGPSIIKVKSEKFSPDTWGD